MSESNVRARWSELADRLLSEIAAGRPPWVRPWKNRGSVKQETGGLLPVSGATRKPYRGVNVLILWLAMDARGWTDNRFYTFQQALKLGTPEDPVAVRKGEKGEAVYFYSRTVQLPFPLKGKLWWPVGHHELKKAFPGGLPEGSKTIPLLKSFTVFNRAQIDGLPVEVPEEVPTVPTENCEPVVASHPEAEALLRRLAEVVPVQYGGDRACYSPALDVIRMPARQQFVNAAAFLATALHEFCHSSGHQSRLARDMSGAFGSLTYAIEEISAESGSAFTLAALGMEYQSQHADYLADWATKLQQLPEKDRGQRLMSAFTAGQRAADCVLAGLQTKEFKAEAETEESVTAMAA